MVENVSAVPTAVHGNRARMSWSKLPREYAGEVPEYGAQSRVESPKKYPVDFVVAMEWELEQLKKLEELQAVYGWDEDDKNLVARKKAIMKKGLQRLKASPTGKKTLSRVPQAEADEEEESVAPGRIAWGALQTIKAKDWESVYSKLAKQQPGNWKRDKFCPQSQVGGYTARRRILLNDEGEIVDRVRVIDQNNGSFEVQWALEATDEEEEPAATGGEEPESHQADGDKPESHQAVAGQVLPTLPADEEAEALTTRGGRKKKAAAAEPAKNIPAKKSRGK